MRTKLTPVNAQCGKPIKTVDNAVFPCLCARGHAGGCNPFSPNPYMAVVMAKDQLPKKALMPLATPITNKPGVIWTDASVLGRCFWQGAHGRCIYVLGGHTEHQEEYKRDGD
jgi:hypothetical protein